MGAINTRKSGQYVSTQAVKTSSGSVVPASTTALQQTLVGGDTNVQFEGSPIETVNMQHASTITNPAFPGVNSGTVNGIAQATSGYSNKLMISNSPAVTNSAKKNE